MKYYIIAGEPSGDLHGSNLIKGLKTVDKEASIRCWGGDLMQQAGGDLQKHYKELAFMGFVEVVMNIRTIFKNFKFCKKDILAFKPDTLILIDYAGFNLKVAKWAHEQGIRVVYYISPQVWAWHKSRVHDMKKYIDQLIVILPFEEDFFKQYNMPVEYVGHPLLDVIQPENTPTLQFKTGKPVIALLPGSRKQEIKYILSKMLEVVDDFPDYQFVVAATTNQPKALYEKYIGNKHVEIVFDQTYPLLHTAKAALVKSGTGTLETALFGVPEVVCYKGNHFSYVIAKKLIKGVDYIALVNLIMGKEVVKELIQYDLNKEQIKQALNDVLTKKLQPDYDELRKKLGHSGASLRAADKIFNKIKRY